MPVVACSRLGLDGLLTSICVYTRVDRCVSVCISVTFRVCRGYLFQAAASIVDTMTLIQILETKQKALTVREVAELLGVSKTHIYEMVADGRLPSFRLGRSIRIDASDIAELVRNKKPSVVQHAGLKSLPRQKNLGQRRNQQENPSADRFLRKRINYLEAAAAMENSNAK